MVVYERNVDVGGLLRYGIPTMKLGKDVRISYTAVSVCLVDDSRSSPCCTLCCVFAGMARR